MVAKGERKIENELRLFRELMDRSNDSLYIVDAETSMFLDVNKMASESMGYSRKEFLSMSVTDIETILPDDFAWKKHTEALKKAGSLIIAGLHKRKDGSTFPIEVSTAYITVEGADYIVAVVHDMTKQKAAEAEMQKKVEDLETFQRVTMGREMRVVELKEEIRILKERLAEYEES